MELFEEYATSQSALIVQEPATDLFNPQASEF